MERSKSITTRVTWLLSLLSIVLISCSTVARSEELKTITILGSPGEMAEKILKIKGQPMERKGLMLILEVCDKEKSMNLLLECARALYIEMCAIRDNIDNVNTTRVADTGEPYAREVVKIDDRGCLIIERQRDFQFIYDPDHPDAFKDGKHKGYVAVPNIDREEEERHIHKALKELHVIVQALKLLEPSLIVEEPGIPSTAANEFRELLEKSRAHDPKPPPATHHLDFEKLMEQNTQRTKEKK